MFLRITTLFYLLNLYIVSLDALILKPLASSQTLSSQSGETQIPSPSTIPFNERNPITIILGPYTGDQAPPHGPFSSSPPPDDPDTPSSSLLPNEVTSLLPEENDEASEGKGSHLRSSSSTRNNTNEEVTREKNGEEGHHEDSTAARFLSSKNTVERVQGAADNINGNWDLITPDPDGTQVEPTAWKLNIQNAGLSTMNQSFGGRTGENCEWLGNNRWTTTSDITYNFQYNPSQDKIVMSWYNKTRSWERRCTFKKGADETPYSKIGIFIDRDNLPVLCATWCDSFYSSCVGYEVGKVFKKNVCTLVLRGTGIADDNNVKGWLPSWAPTDLNQCRGSGTTNCYYITSADISDLKGRNDEYSEENLNNVAPNGATTSLAKYDQSKPEVKEVVTNHYHRRNWIWWGGTCTCPNGQSYKVAADWWWWGGLQCDGGTPVRNQRWWDWIGWHNLGMGVTCGSKFEGVQNRYSRTNWFGWGGTCTCPNGETYVVADNGDYCRSLGCDGGISNFCYPWYPWYRGKVGWSVTCAADHGAGSHVWDISCYKAEYQMPVPRSHTSFPFSIPATLENVENCAFTYCGHSDGKKIETPYVQCLATFHSWKTVHLTSKWVKWSPVHNEETDEFKKCSGPLPEDPSFFVVRDQNVKYVQATESQVADCNFTYCGYDDDGGKETLMSYMECWEVFVSWQFLHPETIWTLHSEKYPNGTPEIWKCKPSRDNRFVKRCDNGRCRKAGQLYSHAIVMVNGRESTSVRVNQKFCEEWCLANEKICVGVEVGRKRCAGCKKMSNFCSIAIAPPLDTVTDPNDKELRKRVKINGTFAEGLEDCPDPLHNEEKIEGPAPAPAPSKGTIKNIGHNSQHSGKLKLCEGDCDADSQCEGDLICFQRNPGDPVPDDCDGEGHEGTDYCTNPKSEATETAEAGTSGQTNTARYQRRRSQTPLVSRGSFGNHNVGRDEFNRLFHESKHKIIHRECSDCPDSHKNVYYKRIKNFDTFDPYGKLLLSWTEEDNKFNEDFELYSDWNAAVKGKVSERWQFCNFHRAYGAFRECGPTGRVTDAWCLWNPTADDLPPGTTLTVKSKTWGPFPRESLGICEGDCDSDRECASLAGMRLVCDHRNDRRPVPGCNGAARTAYDYCVMPRLGSNEVYGRNHVAFYIPVDDESVEESTEDGCIKFVDPSNEGQSEAHVAAGIPECGVRELPEVPAPTPPPPYEGTYTTYLNRKTSTRDYGSGHGAIASSEREADNLKGCQILCTADPSCECTVYNESTKKCYKGKECDVNTAFSTTSDHYFSIKIKDKRGMYDVKTGLTGHSGRGMTSTSEAMKPSKEECEAFCSADPYCDCFTYYPVSKMCYKRQKCDPPNFSKCPDQCDLPPNRDFKKIDGGGEDKWLMNGMRHWRWNHSHSACANVCANDILCTHFVWIYATPWNWGTLCGMFGKTARYTWLGVNRAAIDDRCPSIRRYTSWPHDYIIRGSNDERYGCYLQLGPPAYDNPQFTYRYYSTWLRQYRSHMYWKAPREEAKTYSTYVKDEPASDELKAEADNQGKDDPLLPINEIDCFAYMPPPLFTCTGNKDNRLTLADESEEDWTDEKCIHITKGKEQLIRNGDNVHQGTAIFANGKWGVPPFEAAKNCCFSFSCVGNIDDPDTAEDESQQDMTDQKCHDASQGRMQIMDAFAEIGDYPKCEMYNPRSGVSLSKMREDCESHLHHGAAGGCEWYTGDAEYACQVNCIRVKVGKNDAKNFFVQKRNEEIEERICPTEVNGLYIEQAGNTVTVKTQAARDCPFDENSCREWCRVQGKNQGEEGLAVFTVIDDITLPAGCMLNKKEDHDKVCKFNKNTSDREGRTDLLPDNLHMCGKEDDERGWDVDLEFLCCMGSRVEVPENVSPKDFQKATKKACSTVDILNGKYEEKQSRCQKARTVDNIALPMSSCWFHKASIGAEKCIIRRRGSSEFSVENCCRLKKLNT
eukprot:g2444.t1